MKPPAQRVAASDIVLSGRSADEGPHRGGTPVMEEEVVIRELRLVRSRLRNAREQQTGTGGELGQEPAIPPSSGRSSRRGRELVVGRRVNRDEEETERSPRGGLPHTRICVEFQRLERTARRGVDYVDVARDPGRRAGDDAVAEPSARRWPSPRNGIRASGRQPE